MSQPDDWDDEALSKLYRQMPELTPDPATDARILAAARRAVGAGPRRRAWYGGLATAAVVVLAVALSRHAPEPAPTPVASSARAPAASDMNHLTLSAPAAPVADSAAANAALERAAEARVAHEDVRASKLTDNSHDLNALFADQPAAAPAARPNAAVAAKKPQEQPVASAAKARIQLDHPATPEALAQAAPAAAAAADESTPSANAGLVAPAAKTSPRLAFAAGAAPHHPVAVGDAALAAETSAAAVAPPPVAAAPTPAPVILSREPASRRVNGDAMLGGKLPTRPPRLEADGSPVDYRPLMAKSDYQGAWYQISSLDAADSNDPWLRLDYDLLARLSDHPATTLCNDSTDAARELRDACALLQAEPGSRRQKALRRKLAHTLGKDAEHAYWWQAQKDLP